MLDWLFEGRLTVYVILGGLALLSLLVYSRERKSIWALFGGVFLALVLVYFLLDLLVETGREQVRRKLDEMSAAVQAHNADAILRHVSSQFHLGSLDRTAFAERVKQVLSRGAVDEVKIWDIEDNADWSSSSRKAQVVFRAKPVGSATGDAAFYRVEADFVRDPDGQWRLATFRVFNPVVNTREPLDIPQMGP